MRHSILLLFFLLIFLTTSIDTYSQSTQEKGWVQLSKDFSKEIPIYDIKVNTKDASNTDQYILATFTDGQNEVILNSGTRRSFWSLENGLTWSFSFNQGGKNKKLKIEKSNNKNDTYSYLNLAKQNIGPVRIKDIQKNFLIENVYVQIEKDGYYYIYNNQPYLAIPYLQPLAEKGNEEAMFMLAKVYENGDEIQQREAFKLFEKLVNLGYDKAIWHLALYYIEGKIVKQDLKKAETLLLLTDEIHAQLLSINLKVNVENDNIYNWNPRKEGLIHPAILEEYGKLELRRLSGLFEYLGTAGRSFWAIGFFIENEEEDYLNQNLKYIFTHKSERKDYWYYEEPSWIRDPHILSCGISDHTPGRNVNTTVYEIITGKKSFNVSEFFESCLKLLKSGRCDWMWVYMPNSYIYKKVDDMPSVIWDALGVSQESSIKLKFSKLIEKWCDIALQTPDIELYEQLFKRIDNYHLKEVVTDKNILRKVTLMVKRGADLGIEPCVQYYEKLYLGGF